MLIPPSASSTTPLLSSSGMSSEVDALELCLTKMSIYLGCGQINMTQQLLDGAKVGPTLQQVSGESVAQSVRRNVLAFPDGREESLHRAARSPIAHARTAYVDKEGAERVVPFFPPITVNQGKFSLTGIQQQGDVPSPGRSGATPERPRSPGRCAPCFPCRRPGSPGVRSPRRSGPAPTSSPTRIPLP